MNKIISTQAQRLIWILNHLDITPYKLSKDLGYKSPDTIYHIINGKNQISLVFIDKLKKAYNNINPEWLLKGHGEPTLYALTGGEYGNEYAHDGKLLYPARLSFFMLKKLAQNLANSIFFSPDEVSFQVKVKVSAIEGLEFNFELFTVEGKKKFKEKNYIIIVRPDWRVGLFFDYWRVDEPSRRCQNLLEYSEGNVQAFTKAVFLTMENLDKSIFDEKPFLKLDDTFKELYRTDSR